MNARTVPAYTPEPDDMVDRLTAIMRRNPHDGISLARIAHHFTLSIPLARKQLEPAVFGGWLRIEEGAYHLTARSATPPPKDAVDTPPASPTPRKRRSRNALPPIDLATIEVRTNVPLPPGDAYLKRRSRYAELLDRLTAPGQSVTLPAQYEKTLRSACKLHSKKHGAKFAVRVVDPQHIGIWRTA